MEWGICDYSPNPHWMDENCPNPRPAPKTETGGPSRLDLLEERVSRLEKELGVAR